MRGHLAGVRLVLSPRSLEELVRREMGGAYALSVPLDVSVGVGRNWDAAGH